MQKELLTQEHIVEDLCRNERLRYDRSQFFFTSGVACASFALFFSLALNAWFGLVLGLPAAILFGLEVRKYLQYRKLRQAIREGHYTVTSEILTACNEEDVRSANTSRGREPRYVLYLGGEDYCIINDNYPWSRDFRLSYNGMVNTSVVGDEFWVARAAKTEEIGAVYNKKFFDYKP